MNKLRSRIARAKRPWALPCDVNALPLPRGDGCCVWHRIEAPCWSWNDRPLLRISVAAYNDEGDLRRLEAALADLP